MVIVSGNRGHWQEAEKWRAAGSIRRGGWRIPPLDAMAACAAQPNSHGPKSKPPGMAGR
jgi:hypothetical protein